MRALLAVGSVWLMLLPQAAAPRSAGDQSADVRSVVERYLSAREERDAQALADCSPRTPISSSRQASGAGGATRL